MEGIPKERVNVLGVGVDPVTVAEFYARMLSFVREGRHALVLHANVRSLNLCYRHPELRFFNAALLIFCDGSSVMLAAHSLGGRIPERIHYGGWRRQLAAFAEREGLSLFLLGARPDVAERAAVRLEERHPDLKIAGIHHGYFDRTVGTPENEAVVGDRRREPRLALRRIRHAAPGARADVELGSYQCPRLPHLRPGPAGLYHALSGGLPDAARRPVAQPQRLAVSDLFLDYRPSRPSGRRLSRVR